MNIETESRNPLGFHRLLDRMDRIFGVIFIFIVLLNFLSAAGRYLGGHPIMGADEVQVYSMIWLIFLGAVMAAMRRVHLRMDVLTTNLKPRWAWWRDFAETLLVLSICGAMVVVSLQFTFQIAEMNQKSDAAQIPMLIPHISIVAGFLGMVIAALMELNVLIKRFNKQK